MDQPYNPLPPKWPTLECPRQACINSEKVILYIICISCERANKIVFYILFAVNYTN